MNSASITKKVAVFDVRNGYADRSTEMGGLTPTLHVELGLMRFYVSVHVFYFIYYDNYFNVL